MNQQLEKNLRSMYAVCDQMDTLPFNTNKRARQPFRVIMKNEFLAFVGFLTARSTLSIPAAVMFIQTYLEPGMSEDAFLSFMTTSEYMQTDFTVMIPTVMQSAAKVDSALFRGDSAGSDSIARTLYIVFGMICVELLQLQPTNREQMIWDMEQFLENLRQFLGKELPYLTVKEWKLSEIVKAMPPADSSAPPPANPASRPAGSGFGAPTRNPGPVRPPVQPAQPPVQPTMPPVPPPAPPMQNRPMNPQPPYPAPRPAQPPRPMQNPGGVFRQNQRPPQPVRPPVPNAPRQTPPNYRRTQMPPYQNPNGNRSPLPPFPPTAPQPQNPAPRTANPPYQNPNGNRSPLPPMPGSVRPNPFPHPDRKSGGNSGQTHVNPRPASGSGPSAGVTTLRMGERIVLSAYADKALEIRLVYSQLAVKLDIDSYVFLLNEVGRVTRDTDLVFFGNPMAANGAARVNAQCAFPSGILTLNNLPACYKKAAVCFSAYGDREWENFQQVRDPALQILADGQELYYFPLNQLTHEKTVVGVEFYQNNGVWKMRAVGAGYNGKLKTLCESYGVVIV